MDGICRLGGVHLVPHVEPVAHSWIRHLPPFGAANWQLNANVLAVLSVPVKY
jgi:hypothetical protein